MKRIERMFEEFLQKEDTLDEFKSLLHNEGCGTYEKYYTLEEMHKYCRTNKARWDTAILHTFVWKDDQRTHWSDNHDKWQKTINKFPDAFLFEKVEVTDNLFEV